MTKVQAHGYKSTQSALALARGQNESIEQATSEKKTIWIDWSQENNMVETGKRETGATKEALLLSLYILRKDKNLLKFKMEGDYIII